MKIAFLFLTVAGIYHEECWVDYFNNQDAFSIYVHSKKGVPRGSFFKAFEIPRKVPTSWENTMKAQIELLRAALKDPENQKFIFLSESTIPLQPFTFTYNYLLAHPHSEFSYKLNHHADRTYRSLKKEHVYKNSQWVILNREHAELMVADTKLVNLMAEYPYDNEHYPSTFLLMHKREHEIVKHDCTLVIGLDEGSKHPHTFQDLKKDTYADCLFDAILSQNVLFARKFSETCSISELTEYSKRLDSK